MRADRVEAFTKTFLAENAYNRPIRCEKCNGIMVFKGVGEYCCEDCKHVAYDDFGKVRNYLDEHKGATTLEVENMTGVSQKSIRKMLKEDRLEVAADSRSFLMCELCGSSIRSGRFCTKCLALVNKQCEDMARAGRIKPDIQGYGLQKAPTSEGAKRYTRGQ